MNQNRLIQNIISNLFSNKFLYIEIILTFEMPEQTNRFKIMATLSELKLTALENLFIEKLVPLLYAEPYFTDVQLKDMSGSMGISIDSAKGVLGSLVKKGIIITQLHETFDFKKVGRTIKKIVTAREFIILSDEYHYLHPNWV